MSLTYLTLNPSPYKGYGVHTSRKALSTIDSTTQKSKPHPRFTPRVNLSLSLLRRGTGFA
jgi:hypothetical protein